MGLTCKCTWRQRMLGDGCHICNPEYLCDSLVGELLDLTKGDQEVYARCMSVSAGFCQRGRRDLGVKLSDAVNEAKFRLYVQPTQPSKPLSGDALARYKSELVQ